MASPSEMSGGWTLLRLFCFPLGITLDCLPLDGCAIWPQVHLSTSPFSDLEICCYSSPETWSSSHSFFKPLFYTIGLNTISPSSFWPPLHASHRSLLAAFSNSIIFPILFFKGSQPLSRNSLPCITFTCYTFSSLLYSLASRDSPALERSKK